jgi:hypothetical protein
MEFSGNFSPTDSTTEKLSVKYVVGFNGSCACESKKERVLNWEIRNNIFLFFI